MFELIASYPPTEFLTFLAAALVLNLTPGADVIFATASGLSGGARAGIMAGLGVGLGGLWHVALACLGISALIAAEPAALAALRYAGAGYLLWLAVRSWRGGGIGAGARGARNPSRALWRGFVTNALNPKVALFVLAFLPQFTHPEYGPAWLQILVLGGVFTLTGTVVTASYGALAGRFGARFLQGSRIFDRISAIVFAGLAGKLLTD
ncbi:LysE family translocator [Defluviimonas sp. WL0002]|uniref:LysE family translocator n=1 Tax=Albidovulum marisflavi TaxID=2984159 RepID=A0ABT2Z7W0_9RHOB|nr:LysE family translocator [Defluviimonas sp. WL0002]MCV2867229.1 LysE family translocator [Defluviimonas sp. WL0002]